jgi:hypothetical protein
MTFNTEKLREPAFKEFGGTNAVQKFWILRKRLETHGQEMAPQVGFEPTTLRLTAGCSAIELLRSVVGCAQTAHPAIEFHHNILGCRLKTEPRRFLKPLPFLVFIVV